MIIIPSARGVLSARGDPDWASVVYLCHFDSSSGSPLAYVQSSPRGTAIVNHTTTTSPNVSSAQSKFGGFSLGYAASGNTYCESGPDADYQMGTGDFTIEWFQRLSSISATYVLFDLRVSEPQVAPAFNCIATGVVQYYVNGSNRITSAANSLIVNTWQHIALSRAGTDSKLWVDGGQVGSTYTDSNNYNAANSNVRIGAAFNGGLPILSSFIDEVRITKGVARYTSTFTPPTAPFPNG